jgi:hypothetical protein
VPDLLWVEVALKAAAGLTLVLLPVSAISLVGMERPASGFWPRLLGAVVLAIAIGVALPLYWPDIKGGIGYAGLVPINLLGAAAMLAPLIMGSAAPSKRGKAFIFANALTLLALAFVEISYI